MQLSQITSLVSEYAFSLCSSCDTYYQRARLCVLSTSWYIHGCPTSHSFRILRHRIIQMYDITVVLYSSLTTIGQSNFTAQFAVCSYWLLPSWPSLWRRRRWSLSLCSGESCCGADLAIFIFKSDIQLQVRRLAADFNGFVLADVVLSEHRNGTSTLLCLI